MAEIDKPHNHIFVDNRTHRESGKCTYKGKFCNKDVCKWCGNHRVMHVYWADQAIIGTAKYWSEIQVKIPSLSPHSFTPISSVKIEHCYTCGYPADHEYHAQKARLTDLNRDPLPTKKDALTANTEALRKLTVQLQALNYIGAKSEHGKSAYPKAPVDVALAALRDLNQLITDRMAWGNWGERDDYLMALNQARTILEGNMNAARDET